MLSAETPMMVTPAASNLSFSWAKAWASMSQPWGVGGRIEVDDDRPLLQRGVQREVELLARERGAGGKVGSRFSGFQGGEPQEC